MPMCQRERCTAVKEDGKRAKTDKIDQNTVISGVNRDEDGVRVMRGDGSEDAESKRGGCRW